MQISGGTPALLLVGLPDKAVGEARERMRAALSAIGLSLPPRRVLINLAPADLLKEGSLPQLSLQEYRNNINLCGKSPKTHLPS